MANRPRAPEECQGPNRKNKKADSITIDLSKLEKSNFPKFGRPREVTIFSTRIRDSGESSDGVSGNANELLDKYALKEQYSRTLHANNLVNRMNFVEPESLHRVSFDLNSGYGLQNPKDRENEHLSILLQCLVRDGLVGQTEFVCWRGLLTKVGASPYEVGGKFDDGLLVVVQKLGNVFYMYEFPTENAKLQEANTTERQKLMQYWGMKFETYVTAKPGEKTTPEQPIDLNLEFGSVVQTTLGGHSLLYGGEVDCFLSDDDKRYVELKTSRLIENRRQEYSFRRYKLIKWWLQSFLIGIEDILCGFRDDEGTVKECRWYKVSDIPRIIKQDRDHCRPAACFAFIDNFLNFVKSEVTTEGVPHVFTRQPGTGEFQMELDREGTYKFLPHWFVTLASQQLKKGS